MTPEQFCYWLQGYFELKRTIDHRLGATQETMEVIEQHLQTVFNKVTPEVKVSPTYKDLSKVMQLPAQTITYKC
ncbi:hypothetical protein [Pseudomonas phage TC6]|uniref:Uncharacterized protein n=1 Tax=Pseudomonas phage TC6 TaxID=2060947 RepID=A0A2H5BQC3_9CAUD|nr:hypothetical protein [Pseudomonas phage TC6]